MLNVKFVANDKVVLSQMLLGSVDEMNDQFLSSLSYCESIFGKGNVISDYTSIKMI